MSIKQALLIILLGSSALVSINAFNAIFYLKVTWSLLAQVIAGPVIAVCLLSGKYKEYRIRMLVFIFTLAGAGGILQVLGEIAGIYVYGEELKYPNRIYIYHSLVSLICISVFFIWHVFDKRGHTKGKLRK